MFLIPDDSWEVRKVPGKGRGLFAKKDIEAGTVIGDYLGKIIHPTDEDSYDRDGHFYLMYYHDRASIFPDLKKPGIHLLNHSCTPNCWMYTYKGHTLFFAIRKIFAGEEFTVSYLLSPQDTSCDPCTHLCSCGSELCNQTMHLSQKRSDAWNKFLAKQEKETKRERIKYNQQLQPLSSYPHTIPDDPLYVLFGNLEKEPMHVLYNKLPSRSEIRRLIREHGKALLFPDLKIQIDGVSDDLIIAKSVTK